MQEIQKVPYHLIVEQKDGSHLEVDIPDFAEIDAKLIGMWLYGKAIKTQQAYIKDVLRFYECVKKPILLIKDPGDIHDLARSLYHLKPSSRNRTIAAIKSALSYAQKAGIIKYNPGAVVELEKQRNQLAQRIMSERSIDRILAMEEDPRNYAILALLYYAGLRAHEVCNLKWGNLQERNNTGQLEIFGKGEKTRFILLDPETWVEVQKLRESDDTPDDYVFQSRQTTTRTREKDRRMDESTIDDIVRRAAIRVNVEVYTDENGEKRTRVSPHWFRHAHATYAQEHGASISLVQATLGHESIETTAKYSHVRPSESSARFLRGRG
jgi:integrase/recombinase XerD